MNDSGSALRGDVPANTDIEAPAWHGLLGLAAILLRKGRLVFLVTVAAIVVALIISLVLPKQYRAESRFIPETPGGEVSGLAGIAAQFGVNVGNATGLNSPVDLYVELLKSRDLLRKVVLTRYSFRPDVDAKMKVGTIPELLHIGGDDPQDKVRKAVDWLSGSTNTLADLDAGVVTVQTFAPWRQLAVSINDNILTQIKDFNMARRRTRAGSERAFLEARLDSSQAQLDAAEKKYSKFLTENRAFQNSPELTFQADRLRSKVELQRQLQTALAQAYEQARLEEVRNTPVISMIDVPEGSTVQTRPRLLLNVVLAGLLGFLGAISWVLVGYQVNLTRERWPAEYQAMVSAARTNLGRRHGGAPQ